MMLLRPEVMQNEICVMLSRTKCGRKSWFRWECRLNKTIAEQISFVEGIGVSGGNR